jgi:methyl-accepting chemotaxis protein
MNPMRRLFPGLKGQIRFIFIVIFSITAVVFAALIFVTLRVDLGRIVVGEQREPAGYSSDLHRHPEALPASGPVYLPREEVDAIIRRTLTVIAIALVIGITGISAMIGVIFSRVLKPVGSILDVGAAVSEGDLTKRIEIVTDDEIGEIAGQFDMIITNFSLLLQDIRHTASVLQSSVQDLSVSSREIATTSNQQAAAVREIVSTMEDADRLSKDVHQRVEEVSRVSVDTREIVESGLSVIDESLEKMKEIRGANADTIRGMRLLGEKIDNIWEIVNIINGIADQTKIIAFNAELEASAAGEAGKNFQIVASEIRRLADSTVSSTSKIKERITEIQHSSDRLIIASEEGTGKISAGLKLSENIKNRFDEIQSSSQISARSAKQISRTIGQQVTAFEQILRTLKQISEGIDSFVGSVKSMTTSSEHLNNQALRLTTVVDEFRVNEE